MKLAKKLGLGFAMILGLLVVVGAIGIVQLLLVNHNYRSGVLQAEAVKFQAMSLQKTILDVRRSEKDILARQDMAFYDIGISQLDKTTAILDALDALSDDEALRRKTIAAREAITVYRDGFEVLASTSQEVGLSNDQGLKGTVTSSIGAILDMIRTKGGVADGEILVLTLNQIEMDYLLNPNEAAAGKFDQVQERLVERFNRSGLASTDKAIGLAYLSGSRMAFAQMVEKNSNLQRVLVDMDEKADGVIALGQEISELAKARADAEAAAIRGSASRAIWVMVLISLSSIGGGAAFALFLARSITVPLQLGVNMATEVAGGDLTGTLTVQNQDEIGQLNGALNTMVAGLNGLVQRVGLSLQDLSRITQNITQSSGRLLTAADLQLSSVEETTSAITEMKFSIRNVSEGVDSLNLSATDNRTSILELTASIDEVAQNVDYLAQSVEEVSASIAQMSASIRQVAAGAVNLRDASAETVSSVVEIDASIREVKQNALATAEVADLVRQDAETGKAAVDSTIAGMADIRRASSVTSEVIDSLSTKAESIGSILAVIDSVVDQINLLSLNAAIIAAQAGVHGLGFSVVADEIKELASRTTESTKEIDELIQAVQGETRRAVKAIEQTELAVTSGEKLSNNSGILLIRIVDGIQKATRQTGDIARATEEQSLGIKRIMRSSEQVADMVSQIAGATQQQEKGSELIMGATEKMRGVAHQVKSSTREQSRASNSIASATEAMADMIAQIQRACDEQNTGSEQIARSAENISSATTINHQATRILDEAVGDLKLQSETLRQELAAFRIAEQAKSSESEQESSALPG